MKTAISAFLTVLVISSIGIWSCSQQKCTSQARRIQTLEKNYLKLEDDYRAVVAASENTRKKMARMESKDQERAQQMEEMKLVLQERDDLRQKLVARTNERDNLLAQMQQNAKDGQALLRDCQAYVNRMETAANLPITGSSNGTPVAAPPPTKSN